MRKLALIFGIILLSTLFTLIVFLQKSDFTRQEKGNLSELLQEKIVSKDTAYTNRWKKDQVPLGKRADMIVAGGNDYVAVVGMQTILVSLDKGKTWSELSKGKGNYFTTIDGGITYRYDSRDKILNLVDVKDLCSVESAVITPSGRLYLKTTCDHTVQLWSVPIKNQSEDWCVTTFTYEEDPSDGVYSPSSKFVLAGERVLIEASLIHNSAILTTDDYGKTWYPFWRSSYFGYGIATFDFLDNNNGWLLLGDGNFFQTVDGGRTWKAISRFPSEIAEELCSMDFVSIKKGFMVGLNGKIFSTTDGGITWQQQNSGVTFDLYNIIASNESRVWVTGSSNLVIESLDGGRNWQNVDLGIERGIYTRMNLINGVAWIASEQLIYHFL
jgi:photosystem II stability/assembly factor-like uncharacterized protein